MGLAGPRNKQRLGYDPQNQSWSTDTGKFGYKMLEKMGWSAGKGLGANEDGAQEHVKVKFKQDALGVGADARSIDNWMDNTFALDDILKNLNKSTTNDNNIAAVRASASAEGNVDGQLFGRKLVRKKFIRNKTVSNYDTQDIGMILGLQRTESTASHTSVSSLNVSTAQSSIEESPSLSDPSEQDTSSEQPVVTNQLKVVKEQNVSDYFASKLGSTFADSRLVYLRGSQSVLSSLMTNTKRDRAQESDDERPSFGGIGSTPTVDRHTEAALGADCAESSKKRNALETDDHKRKKSKKDKSKKDKKKSKK